jgi:hypothetical protein
MYALGWGIIASLAVIIIIILTTTYNNISVVYSLNGPFVCIADTFDLRTGQVVPAVTPRLVLCYFVSGTVC